MIAERTDRSTVLVGHVLDQIRLIPDGVVQTCITSPPYWGLRDYGTEPQVWPDGWRGHLGLEPTPDLYVEHLVEVFREVWRVLRDDGTLWLNLGDSYAGFHGNAKTNGAAPSDKPGYRENMRATTVGVGGLKNKDLVGIPWMTAFALRSSGWYLRMDNVWAKGVSGQKELTRQLVEALTKAKLTADQITRTMAHLEPYVGNCMPESVKDRSTRSHEYMFLLTKGPKYYYDGFAVMDLGQTTVQLQQGGRNRRSVWVIPTRPFKGAHFAVFPPALVEAPLLASTPEFGSCAACGAPYERVVTKGQPLDAQRAACGADSSGEYHGTAQKDYAPTLAQDPSATKARILAGMVTRETTGWRAACTCEADVIPALVLDPFGGSGTVVAVAELYGRRAVSIELNPEYAHLHELRRKDVRRALRR